MSTTRPYVVGFAPPKNLEQLQQYLMEEFQRIADSIQSDIPEVGDSEHATSLETGLLIWVNRSGTLSADRVSIGAADSGGVGYRLLRVAN